MQLLHAKPPQTTTTPTHATRPTTPPSIEDIPVPKSPTNSNKTINYGTDNEATATATEEHITLTIDQTQAFQPHPTEEDEQKFF